MSSRAFGYLQHAAAVRSAAEHKRTGIFRPKRSLYVLPALCLGLIIWGCSDQTNRRTAEDPPPDADPLLATSPAEPLSDTTEPPAPKTQPGERAEKPPETAPADEPPPRPVSSYDSKPPYPVQLHVLDPGEEQPGWLRIVELADDSMPASAQGTFPEQNNIHVQTQNVRRIEVHVGHLPIGEGKRISLLIDRQGIELVRQRMFVNLERRATGAWIVLPPPPVD